MGPERGRGKERGETERGRGGTETENERESWTEDKTEAAERTGGTGNLTEEEMKGDIFVTPEKYII